MNFLHGIDKIKYASNRNLWPSSTRVTVHRQLSIALAKLPKMHTITPATIREERGEILTLLVRMEPRKREGERGCIKGCLIYP